jgi:FtsH-binding integral membrane protein
MGLRKRMAGMKNFFELVQKKKVFLLTVFANLIAQLGITYWTMMNYPVDKKQKVGFSWFYIIVQFIIILILAMVSMPAFLKFLLFCAFSFIWGILFSSYRENPIYSGLIKFAVAGTASIFGVMAFIGILLIVFGIQLGAGFGLGLFIALLLLLISQIIDLINGAHYKWIGAFGLVLFSLYIVYDTNTILQRDYSGDFIRASLDYYLDVINIFLDLLNISNN